MTCSPAQIESKPEASAAVATRRNDSVEDPLNRGLNSVPELPDSADDGRFISAFADETPDQRIEALLTFMELELDFGRAEKQPMEHLRPIIRRISAGTVVHPLVEKRKASAAMMRRFADRSIFANGASSITSAGEAERVTILKLPIQPYLPF